MNERTYNQLKQVLEDYKLGKNTLNETIAHSEDILLPYFLPFEVAQADDVQYTIHLTSIPSKLYRVKLYKVLTGANLRDAKDYVESHAHYIVKPKNRRDKNTVLYHCRMAGAQVNILIDGKSFLTLMSTERK